MNNVDPFPPAALRGGGDTPSTARPWRPLAVLAVCLTVLGASLWLIVAWPGPTEAGPLVVSEANATVTGSTISRPIEIAADGVTLRRVLIVVDGASAVTIRPGVLDTVIEESEIHCVGATGDAVAVGPGEYTAVRVRTHGCGRPFARTLDAPATILDSSVDGEPYTETVPGSITVAADPADVGAVEGPAVTPRRVAASAPTPLGSWPGPDSTGVPAGTVLTRSGPLDLRHDGQVVDGLDVEGCVLVRASNVTIRNTRITCHGPAFAIRMLGTADNLLVTDVEIDGGGRTAAAICCVGYTVRRADIHSSVDGPRVGSRSTVVDSWVHRLVRTANTHNDAVQAVGGSDIVVRRNRLDAYRPDTADPMNACLMIGSKPRSAVRNVLVEGNYCTGGNYSIGVRADLTGSGIVIRANTFGRDYRYGVIARPDQPGVEWDRPSNIWFDTGEPVVG
ncbi:hypothetical protein O7627_30070 [Solwaraspora sp. WMMD1047]|uniref:hypothetical protein n=1 Tax=Solwaraspora sp. WMMD1047 TaxID=3016102 RepID=UPI002416B44C|nr:hypothetical protein [Solwaraspora sp. WMMD1047]MDG4833523.1 hypothetical protein [Solwaraspora sp. WMMD1047]